MLELHDFGKSAICLQKMPKRCAAQFRANNSHDMVLNIYNCTPRVSRNPHPFQFDTLVTDFCDTVETMHTHVRFIVQPPSVNLHPDLGLVLVKFEFVQLHVRRQGFRHVEEAYVPGDVVIGNMKLMESVTKFSRCARCEEIESVCSVALVAMEN